jgi:hypothetical protein
MTIAAAALGASAALFSAGAAAQTPDPWSLSDAWRFNGSIYGYFPTIGGKTTFPQSGSGSDVSVSAEQIISNLKFVFMGNLSAQKGRWGLFTDVLYMDVGGSKSDTRDINVGGVPLPVGATANANLDIKGTVWTLAGSYRVLAEPGVVMDVLGGARLLSLKETLGWQVNGNVGPIPLPGRSGNSEAKVDLWDGIVGVKGQLGFGNERRWVVPYYLDVGTGQSDLTWQAMGGFGYMFNWGDVYAAWRYLDYNMKSGDKIEDVNFSGPMIAFTFRW